MNNLVNLSKFFMTRSTLEELGYGQAWKMFGLTHILLLLFTAGFAFVFSFFYKRGDKRTRRILEFVIVGLMLLEEVWMFTISIATNQFEIGFLPLHLCGINIFFCIAHAIFQKDWIFDFLYGLALPGAFIALLMPAWTNAPAWNFIFIFSSGYHILLITYPIMLLAGGWKPKFNNLWKVSLCLLLMGGIVFGLNLFNASMANKTGNIKLWSSNFMFLYKPESVLLTLKNLLKLPGMTYIILLPILLCIIWVLFYTPWIIIDKCKNKKQKNA